MTFGRKRPAKGAGIEKKASQALFRTLLTEMTLRDTQQANVSEIILSKAKLTTVKEASATAQTTEVIKTLGAYFHSEADDNELEHLLANMGELVAVIADTLEIKNNKASTKAQRAQNVENMKEIVKALYEFYARNVVPAIEDSEIERRKNAIIQALFPEPPVQEADNEEDISRFLQRRKDGAYSSSSSSSAPVRPLVPPVEYLRARFNLNSSMTDLRLLEHDNPLIRMLMRFIGNTYRFGGPRPSMLEDFASHYQALKHAHENQQAFAQVSSGAASFSPNYKVALASLTPLDFTDSRHADKKGVQDYVEPRQALHAMDNEKLGLAIVQFEQVMGVLKVLNSNDTVDASLIEGLNRVEETIQTLDKPLTDAQIEKDKKPSTFRGLFSF